MKEVSNSNITLRAYLYFWLPLDKDNFGFENYDSAPLNTKTRAASRQRDQTVSDRLVEYFKHKGASQVSNASFFRNPSTQTNRELGLSKFQIQFVYNASNLGIGNDVPLIKEIDAIGGAFIVYSNGLYIWQLSLQVNDRILEETVNIEDQICNLLSKYFINVVMEVFDGNLSKIPSNFVDDQTDLKPIEKYSGILIDPQLNLLMNTLLDEEVIPQRHFKAEKFEEINISKFRLSNLLESIALYTWDIPEIANYPDRKYLSIGRLPQKSYTLQKDLGEASAKPNLHVKSYDLILQSTELEKELFVSRLVYSAMQHFIEVTNTFVLLHYENGIQFCLQNLSDDAEVQLKQQSPELRQQSMEKSKANVIFLQSYYQKLKTKDPRLYRINQMIKVCLDTSIPRLLDFHAVYEIADSVVGLREWMFSRQCLEIALREQQEKINMLNYSLNSIRDALTVIRDESRNQELSTQTKLEEIEADKDNFNYSFLPKETLELGGGAERFLSTLGILLAVITIIIDIGIEIYRPIISNLWLVLKNAIPAIAIHEAIILFLGYIVIGVSVLFFFRVISRNRVLARFVFGFVPETDPLHQHDTKRKYVSVLEQRFENSALRLRLTAKNHNQLSYEILKVNSRMPSIINPKNANQHAVSHFYLGYEVLSSSSSQYKYDFHTEPEHEEIYYTIHMEVDEDILGREMAITNLRITINFKETYKFDSDTNDLHNTANLVAKEFLSKIVDTSETTDNIFGALVD